MRSLLVILTAIVLSACATRPKTYTAPDATKVMASAKRLSAAVTKASDTAVRAQLKVADAQQSADRVAADSVTVINQVNELAKLVPPELLPKVTDLQTAVEAQQIEEGNLSTHLAGAQKEQAQLTKDLDEAKAAKIELQTNQAKYQADAQGLADDASVERNARIVDEKKLSWYRWHWWGSWIALGAGVLACGIFAFLKFTGRLTLSAAQVAAKVGL
jgi:hypothetical protein